MKLTVKRDVKFKRKEIIAYLDVDQKREDLQSILENHSISELPNRLQEHMKKFDLIDEYGSLTESGEYAKKTGLVKEKEYGQYEVWYHIDEPWFGTLPVAIHRINAGNGNQKQYQNEWTKPEDIIDKFTLKKSDNIQNIRDSDINMDINLRSLTPRAVKKIRDISAIGSITCTAEKLDEKKFNCELSANLGWSQKNKENSFISREIIHKEDPITLLNEILGNDFETESKCVLVDNPPENPTNFTKNENLKNKAGFKEVIIEDIPLRAKDKSCAEKWLKSLLSHVWSTQYVTKEQMEIDQKSWIGSLALSGYGLTVKDTDQVLFEVNEDKQAFWNVAVMYDLRPTKANVRIPFVLEKDEMNVDVKIKKHLFEGRNVSKIIISDRYIENDNIDILKRILPEKSDTIIKIFTRKNLKLKPEEWINEILPQKRDERFDDHNRYWLVKSSFGWEYWSFSHSLTPFKEFEEMDQIYVDSQVNISPVYAIPEYLENEINAVLGGKKE